ncbi:MAG: hypothetical protein JRI54_14435, partial [Deltaproteobacteria bacterium]|nr:hypothetical protein [Deltaproteobacteria bacterium]
MPLKNLSGRKLFEDVVTYAQMGEHRTATEADLKTASWIADRLSAAGFKAGFLKWRLRQFFIEKCELEVEAKTRECFPLWFPKATGAEPVRAPLVLFQEERETQAVRDKIVLVKFDQWFVTPESDHARLIKGLAKEGALAVLGYNPSLSGEVFVSNAFSPFSQESWPIPVVLVGAKERVSLKNAAQRHAMAALLVTGRDEAEAEARNVIGKLK